MALPCSGPISLGDIYNEIYGVYPDNNYTVTLYDLVQASFLADKSAPYNISDFYCYTHGTPYILSWDFTKIGAGTGSMEIYVNGSTVVNTSTSGDSGFFTVYSTQNIGCTVYSSASFCYAYIYKDGSLEASNSNFNNTNASISTFSPTGNVNLSGIAQDNS